MHSWTHPLLDAHTAYGTQLLWPLDVPPTMWATLFIIDPLYTLPLLVAVLTVAFLPTRPWSGRLLAAALALSATYLAWSWLAQGIVKANAREALAAQGLEDAPIFLTPAPFNTLLWRIVVQTETGYLEGYDSLVVAESVMRFDAYGSDKEALEQASNVWAVTRLRWFAQDFVKAEVIGDRLLISDLRMGTEPTYVFTHVAAFRGNPHWEPTTTKLVPVSFDDRSLAELWRRIWSEQ